MNLAFISSIILSSPFHYFLISLVSLFTSSSCLFPTLASIITNNNDELFYNLGLFCFNSAQMLMKSRLAGAQKGHGLLKKKADALQMRFRMILGKIIDVGIKTLTPSSHWENFSSYF